MKFLTGVPWSDNICCAQAKIKQSKHCMHVSVETTVTLRLLLFPWIHLWESWKFVGENEKLNLLSKPRETLDFGKKTALGSVWKIYWINCISTLKKSVKITPCSVTDYPRWTKCLTNKIKNTAADWQLFSKHWWVTALCKLLFFNHKDYIHIIYMQCVI